MHFFTPQETSIMTAAAAGSFIALLVTRKAGWLHVLTLFLVGELTAFYWSNFVVAWLGWHDDTVKNIAFTIGALGMLVWGAIMNLFQRAHDDPFGTIAKAYGLWRGKPDDRQQHDDP